MKSPTRFFAGLLIIGILTILILTQIEPDRNRTRENATSVQGGDIDHSGLLSKHSESGTSPATTEANYIAGSNVDLPSPPPPDGAIDEERLSQTKYRKIYHQYTGGFPLRMERLLRWDIHNEAWQVAEQNQMAANRVLVRSRQDLPEAVTEQYELRTRGTTSPAGWTCFEFEYNSSEDRLGQLLTELQQRGHTVEPDYLIEAADLFSGDPLFQEGKQSYLDGMASFVEGSLAAATFWETQTDASAAIVAILDSGLHLSHEEFSDQLWQNSLEIPGNGIDDDNNGWIDDLHGYNFVSNSNSLWDDHGHGTHVAGLIGATGDNGVGMAGIAWQSSLMPVKVLNAAGNGFVSDVVSGIHYAIDNGADVMLLAWQTGSDSSALRDALEAAQAAGLTWSVPAGNDSKSLDEFPRYPAAYRFENQITVASQDLDGSLSNFSNYSISHVDASAPGNDLISTGNAGNSAYERRTGTSQASALVAGLLAHLRAAHPDEPGWRLIQRVRQSATARTGENYYLHSRNPDYVATGRVNLASPALFAEDSKPINDDLKGARRFERPSFFQSEVMLDATAESGEPAHGGAIAESTVWYEWAPRDAGSASIRTDHPAASLAVYRGGDRFDLFEPVTSAPAAESGASLEFQAQAEVVYFCVVNVSAGTSEPVRTDFRLLPDNHDFINASSFPLGGGGSPMRNKIALSSDGTSGTNEGWQRWVAPFDGLLKSNASAEMDARLTIYEVTAAGDLGQEILSTEVLGRGSRGKKFDFNITANTEYAFRWQSLSGGSGYVSWNGSFVRAPNHVSIFHYFTSSPLWGTEFQIGSSVYDSIDPVVSGNGPYSYKWYRDGELVQNGGWRYYTSSVDFSDAGTYHLVVSNQLGTVESDPIEITVRALPPKIHVWPDAVKSSAGANASFTARISDSLGASVTLEWFLNGVKLQESTRRVFDLENLRPEDSGVFQVRATNRFGTTWSQEVLISISENPLTDWKRVMPNTAGYNLQGASSAGSRYFVTATNAKLHSSPDGTNWIEAIFDRSLDSIGGIAYGNGIYMIVGMRESKPVVLTSDDGISWETIYVATGGTYSFQGLTFGNGRFVTRRNISSNSTMYSSSDGRTWETNDLSNQVYSTALFGNGTFLISWNGTHFLSSDGLNWTAHAIVSDGPTRTGSLTYRDGYFYKISKVGSFELGLYRSTDGIIWEVVSAPGRKGPIDDNQGLYYDGEYFMIPNSFGIQYSATGDWFLRHSGNETGDSSQGSLTDIALLGDELIAIDDIGRIIHGETLTDLTFSEPVFKYDIHRMESLESALVVMGNTGGYSGIAWTRDGVSWHINEGSAIKDIVELNHQFYAIDYVSLVVSSDLNHWSYAPPLPEHGNLIEAGNGRLVVVLEDGRVTTSVDGVNWSTPQATNGQTLGVNEMRFLNGEFWLARDSGLHRSTDGITWQAVALPGIKDITYASGKYIATPYQSGVLYESTDGETWAEALPGGNLTAIRLATDGTSVYGALNGGLLYSENLSEWTSVSLAARSTDVAYFNGSVFYCADGGLVYRHGTGRDAPSLAADITETLRAEVIDLSSTIHFDYTAESASGAVTVSLYVDGELVDQSADGSSLAWAPNRSGRHKIQLWAEGSNGLSDWTDSVEVNVKGASTRSVSNPAEQKATGLLSKNNAAWFTTEHGGLYYRSNPNAKWIALDAGEAVDGFNGTYKDSDGRLYAYGWVFDAFGQSRGIVLRTNEGQVWERLGGLLPNPVVDVLLTEEGEDEAVVKTFYAVTLDPTLTNSTAPSGLHYRRGDDPWTQISGVDTLREIIEWQDQLYAKDRSGNVLVSSDGFEWSLEFDSGSFDTRTNRLEATEDILLLNGSSRVYHNRENGNSWGYIHPEDRTLVSERTVYTESYEGLYELTPQGLLEPTSRFETLYMGGLLGNPVQVEWGNDWSLWRTNTGRIAASNTEDTGSSLEQDDFPESHFTRIGKIAFRRTEGDNLVPLEAPEGWSSNSLAEIAAQAGIRVIAFGDTATLFVGENGLYRHDPSNDTWVQLRSTSDLHALSYSQGRFWLGGSGIFEQSDDSGNTWTSRYDEVYALVGRSLAITEIITDGDRIAVNAVNRDILLSTDGGASWVDTGRRANRIAFTPTELIFAGDNYSALSRKEPGQEILEIERFPFGLPLSYFLGHSWDVRDYLWKAGTEYLLLANYASATLLQRSQGDEWEVVEFPRTIPSTGDYLASTDSKVYWVSEAGISQVVSHNFKTSLIFGDMAALGVGDNFEAVFRINNQGAGPSPETSFTIKAFLQPTEATMVSDMDALPIGSYRGLIPAMSEGEFRDLQINLQLPDFVSPGSYHLRLAGIGMGDARSADNTAVSYNQAIHIPQRKVDIQVNGSGSVTIHDERSEYPDKFALPIQINPNPGYVYSFGGESSGELNASGLQTVILDESFNGAVYFEPSFETWAAEAIPSSESRTRSGIAYGGLPNVFKYLFGYDPTDTSRTPPLTILEDIYSGEHSVAYDVLRGRELESPDLMISEDLESWHVLATESTPEGDRIRFDASVPNTFPDKAFFQLEAD